MGTMSFGDGISVSLLQVARDYTVFTNDGELLPLALTRLDEAEARWLDTLHRHVGDPTLALAVTLVGDGLYHRAALRAEAGDAEAVTGTAGEVTSEQLDALVALLERLRTP